MPPRKSGVPTPCRSAMVAAIPMPAEAHPVRSRWALRNHFLSKPNQYASIPQCGCAHLVLLAQAREEMEYAEESKETTYFDEEAAAAKEAVEGVSRYFRLRRIKQLAFGYKGACL